MSVKNFTMASICSRMARTVPNRIAFVDGDETITFSQFHSRTNQLANALVGKGIKRGDRVAVLLMNGLPMMELFFAAAKIGARIVPLNWRLAAPELDYIIKNASPRLLFIGETFKEIRKSIKTVPDVIMLPAIDAQNRGDYNSFLSEGNDLDLPENVSSEDSWVVLYTSGTTGRPKGCLISHQAKFIAGLALASGLGIQPNDNYLCFLPLFHVAALGIVLAHYMLGAQSVLLPRPPKPENIIKILSRQNCTSLSAPPPLLKMLIDAQAQMQLPLKLRWLTGYGGGEPLEVVRATNHILGATFIGGYGQSESGNFVTLIRDVHQIERPDSCGQLLPHLDIQLQNEFGGPVSEGEIGEVCLRGPSIMNGYWEMESETKEAFQSGWLHTGDMARMDSEGFIYIVDRKKDLIKTGGENVYPREVELRLNEHAAILESCVIGVPDDYWGETVKAFVVLNDGENLSAKDVVAWCREGLAGYKRPKYVEFVSALPRSQTGKIEKIKLKEYPLSNDQAVE